MSYTTGENPIPRTRPAGLAVAFAIAFLGFGTRPLGAIDPSRGAGTEDRARLLLARATWGARPGDLEAMLALGAPAWLERQLDPKRIDDHAVEERLARIPELSAPVKELSARLGERSERPAERKAKAKTKTKQRERPEMSASESEEPAACPDEEDEESESPAGKREKGRPARDLRPAQIVLALSEAKLIRAVASERQLEDVLVDFWFNHFNVYARKSIPTLLTVPSFERNVIRPRVLGKFEDLLVAVAQHPAMLLYLDNWTSVKEGYRPGGGHERQAKPMSKRRPPLASVNVVPARPGAIPATPPPQKKRRKSGINENFARELLELHTLGVDGGYTQDDVVAVARCLTGWTVVDPDLLREERGSGPASRIDGGFHFVAAAHDEDPKVVLGHAISSGGLQDGLDVLHLLATHPSTASFVSRKLAQRFVADEPSPELVAEMSRAFVTTGGDLRAVLRAMFGSPRFVSEGLGAAMVKTPLELVASALRATEGKVESGRFLARSLDALGMPLYLCQPPTGYDEAAATWLGAGALLNRVRFAGELLSGRVRGVDLGVPPADIEAWARSVVARPDRELAPEAARTLSEALAEFPEVKRSDAVSGMAMVLASPAFQRQ